MPKSREPRLHEKEARLIHRKGQLRVGREDYRGWVALGLLMVLAIALVVNNRDAVLILGTAAASIGAYYFGRKEGERR